MLGPAPHLTCQPDKEDAGKIQDHIRHQSAASRRVQLDVFVGHGYRQSQKQNIAGRRPVADAKGGINIAEDHSQQGKLQKVRQLADVMIQILLRHIEPTSSLARCDSAAGMEEL